MATSKEIEQYIGTINELKNSVQETLDKMSSIDPIDDVEKYLESSRMYKEEKRALQKKVDELREIYKSFQDSYSQWNGSSVMEEEFEQTMLQKVEPTLSNMISYYLPDIDSKFSGMERAKQRGLKEYIIHLIKQNPGYMISRREFFKTRNPQLATDLYEQMLDNGFKSIKVNDSSVEYGVASHLIPAFAKSIR